MKKLLITGGAGFIGSHLVKKISAIGFEAVIADRLDTQNKTFKQDRLNRFLDKSDYEFHDIDLSDLENLEKIFKSHQFDAICHLAAKTSLDNSLYNKGNYNGTNNIFELAKKYEVPKIVFASTAQVYGNSDKLPFSENDNTDRPLSLYAATKKNDEILAHAYHYLYKMQMIGLRFFTTYGPWSRTDMAVNKFTEKIIGQEPIQVHDQGRIKRDISYVDDIADGIISALSKDFGYEIFNLGSGKCIELNELIRIIESNVGIEAKKEYVPMKAGDLSATWADITKAERLLDYVPRVSMEEGINKFISWYRDYHKI